jgi:predicted  nucleic acid-binding Zn-ribbon protein
MDDETRQQVLQLVTRLASETDALKSEIAGVKDVLKQLEFRVRDAEAGVGRLEAGIARLGNCFDRLEARVDAVIAKRREQRQLRSDDDQPTCDR